MPQQELPPDPEAVEKWQKLPQNKPTRQALPPAAGGLRWAWGLLALLLLAAALVLLSQAV